MGRFDALTQLDENQAPVKKLDTAPVVSGKKHSPPSRHAFDIYQDQYEALLELSLEERREGGTGSMSAMVREALDKFITERKKH